MGKLSCGGCIQLRLCGDGPAQGGAGALALFDQRLVCAQGVRQARQLLRVVRGLLGAAACGQTPPIAQGGSGQGQEQGGQYQRGAAHGWSFLPAPLAGALAEAATAARQAAWRCCWRAHTPGQRRLPGVAQS